MHLFNFINKLLAYKAWANQITFASLGNILEVEVYKKRETNFNNIAATLNHVYVVDDIFKAHLTGQPHGYTSRNTETCPSLNELWLKQKSIDLWYINYASTLNEELLNEEINFEYIGGGRGCMSKADILSHVVNHGTYHRGFVSDMMYQVPATPPANDLTVFLRDIYHTL